MTVFKRFIYKHIKKIREYLPLRLQKKYFKCVTIRPSNKAIGRVLVSYALAPAGLPDDHPRINYHGCYWMSNNIISIFTQLGYIVDCIQFTNRSLFPAKGYDVVFSFCRGDLARLISASESEDAVKIWHPATSSISYNNAREMERIQDMKKRIPGSLYAPKRHEPGEGNEVQTIQLADHIIFLGNEHVLNTFPKKFHHKFKKLTVAASQVYKKEKKDFVPEEREFVWYFGNGAVHKGLDLLLEVFAKNPQWKLNIIGPVKKESDFMEIYRKELTELPNILLHGYLEPESREFISIIKRCFAFVAPSCSESISLACTTMMQVGLYPLISRDTGIDLPQAHGMYLEDCTIDEIEKKIGEVYELKEKDLAGQIEKTQALALRKYSRDKFSEEIGAFLSEAVKGKE